MRWLLSFRQMAPNILEKNVKRWLYDSRQIFQDSHQGGSFISPKEALSLYADVPHIVNKMVFDPWVDCYKILVEEVALYLQPDLLGASLRG